MTSRIWVLGESGPGMVAIESLLSECGETVVHAMIGGRRVSADEAYRADPIEAVDASTVYYVACASVSTGSGSVSVDNHRQGDAGRGRGPEELCASSLGQVIAELARLGLIPATWERWEVPVKGIGVTVGEIDHYSIFGRFLPPTRGHYVTLGRQSGVSRFAASSDERRGEYEVRTKHDTLIRARIPQELVLALA